MKNIVFSCCIKSENIIYGVAKYFNMLCGWDMEKKQMILAVNIPEEDDCASGISYNIFKVKSDIYIVPFNAKTPWIYSLETASWKKIIIRPENCFAKFYRAFMWRDYLYMIGTFYPAIIKYDLITGECIYFDKPYKIIKEHVKEKWTGKTKIICFLSYVFKNDDTIFLLSAVNNEILEWRLTDDHIDIHSLESNTDTFSYTLKMDQKIWIAPYTGGEFLCWDGKNVLDRISLPEQSKKDVLNYVGGYVKNDIITFLGYNKAVTFSYDLKLKEITMCDNKYIFYNDTTDAHIMQEEGTGIITIIEGENEIEIKIEITEEISHMFNKKPQSIITENPFYNAEWFLGVI